MVGKARGQVCETDASAIRMRRDKAGFQLVFVFSFALGLPHGVMPPIRWVFLRQFIESGNSNRHAQRLVSLMILDPLKIASNFKQKEFVIPIKRKGYIQSCSWKETSEVLAFELSV